MSTRSSSLRIKVVALLLSLFALWAFAATVTAREGLNLLWLGALKDDLGIPADELVTELQQERRLSLSYVGGGTSTQRAALESQRRSTDGARKKFERLAHSDIVELASDDALEKRIDEMSEALTSLDSARRAIDARRIDRGAAVDLFSYPIDAGFRIYGSISTLDDDDVAKYARTMVQMSRSRELLSQEDAMLTGVLAANGRFTAAEHYRFVQLVGAQRFTHAEALAELPAADQDRYHELATGSLFTRFRAMEERAVETAPGSAVPVDAASWKAAADSLVKGRRDLETASANDLIKRATPVAAWVIARLLLAGGLGLIAVIASIVVSITTARSLVRQLEKLRTAALYLATERLPRVVERLRRGEEVDVAAEAPALEFGTDEIGQVGRAFNLVQETAVQVAVEQAALRRGVRDVFLSLARRSQALVHRQLTLLDAMERKESVPEELESLFRVDHLATRMRRNAENLIVLSGAVPGRGWRNPIPLVDVVRGAVAEVEEYERVTVSPIGSAALAGRSVGDVIHLLAELVENALSFSPPHTMVHVNGELVGNGFAVEIEDRGLGMSAEALEAANEQLTNPPEFNLTSTARLGLYVVGRLSERHQLKVRLRSSPYGGVTAVVLIPTSLIVNEGDDPRPNVARDRLAASRAAILAGHGDSRTDETPPEELPPLAAARRDRGVRADRVREAPAPRGLTAMPATGRGRTADRDPEPEEGALPYGATRSADVDVHAPSGLPRRVRQASLAAPLRKEPAVAEEDVPEAPTRPPEDVRRMMSSYQRGTLQARTKAGVPAMGEAEAAATESAQPDPTLPAGAQYEVALPEVLGPEVFGPEVTQPIPTVSAGPAIGAETEHDAEPAEIPEPAHSAEPAESAELTESPVPTDSVEPVESAGPAASYKLSAESAAQTQHVDRDQPLVESGTTPTATGTGQNSGDR
jgi:signal transduction histidine kinase